LIFCHDFRISSEKLNITGLVLLSVFVYWQRWYCCYKGSMAERGTGLNVE
jgi:hypothetical protein